LKLYVGTYKIQIASKQAQQIQLLPLDFNACQPPQKITKIMVT